MSSKEDTIIITTVPADRDYTKGGYNEPPVPILVRPTVTPDPPPKTPDQPPAKTPDQR